MNINPTYKIVLKALLFMLFFVGLFSKGYSQFMAGFGGSYGDDINQFAPNVRVYYFPNHKICFGPEFAHFPSIKEGDVERELTEYGISGHYIFRLNSYLGFYPLIGINYSIEKEKEIGLEGETYSIGANLGAGFHLEFGRYFPFAEYKYVASGLPQNVFSIGVLINVKNQDGEKSHSME